ncbi:MAG: hypothetical protein PHE82_08405 [Syntrophomonadaceae bacterium]|nr:hypothetical protein [Syntrophomonadaceae bacterium]
MNVDERLARAVEMVKEYEKIHSRLETTRSMLGRERNRYNELKKQMALEGRDVERLDGITLHNLWHTLLGTKELAKRKEQEEYLAAKMKFDAAAVSLQMLESDLHTLEQQLVAMGDPVLKYQQAIKEKGFYLLRSGTSDAKHLFELVEQLGYLRAQNKELKEAIEAGEQAKKALSRVENNLGSAQGWGIVDILGGGLITTAIKHSHIGDARNNIDQAQQLLRKFQRELADITVTNTIEIGRISTLADFLLDGALFDIIVQSQINTAQNQTRQLKHKVQGLIQDLQRMQEQTQQEALRLEQERKYIIENAKY